MSYKVAQWGTGHVGGYALRGIVAHPDLDLVAAGAYSEEKVGRDAGTVAGLGAIGVTLVPVTELIGTDVDCVLHTPGFEGSERNPQQAVDEICKILESGTNVSSVALMALGHPTTMGREARGRIEAACRAGEATFFSTGVNPGFFFDLLPIALSSVAFGVRQVRCVEIYNYEAKLDVSIVGFGLPPRPEAPPVHGPLSTHLQLNAHASLALVADAIGITIDRVTQTFEQGVAPEPIKVRAGIIGTGTVCGYRRKTSAWSGGSPTILWEHIGYASSRGVPGWPQPAAGFGNHRWTIDIDAVPRVSSSVDLHIDDGDEADVIAAGGLASLPGSAAVAMRAVNAVPEVVDASPGIQTVLDLRMTPGKHPRTSRTLS